MEHLADLFVGQVIPKGFLLETSFDFCCSGTLTIYGFKVLTCLVRFEGLLIVQLQDARIFYAMHEPADLSAEERSCAPFLRNFSAAPKVCIPVGFENLDSLGTAKGGRFLSVKELYQKLEFLLLVDGPEKNKDRYLLLKDKNELDRYLGGFLPFMGVPLVNIGAVLEEILSRLS